MFLCSILAKHVHDKKQGWDVKHLYIKHQYLQCHISKAQIITTSAHQQVFHACIFLFGRVISQLQSTTLLVIYNTQKVIKLTPTEKSIIQHSATTEADRLLKIVHTITLFYKQHIVLFKISMFNLQFQT